MYGEIKMSKESKFASHAEYDNKTFDGIRFRVRKGKKELLKECAKVNGESVNAMLNRLTDDEIKRVLGK